MTEPIEIKISQIRTDGGTQPRAQLNYITVNEYAESIEDGATFPPVEVMYDGSDYWLWDGFHRVESHKKAGCTAIRANVKQGTRRDAVLASVGANNSHGLRRTNDDKRRAVMTLLNDAEWVKWSDREIARHCKVSHELVRQMRPILTVNIDSMNSERTFIHPKTGQTATMQTANIGKAVTPPVAPSFLSPKPASAYVPPVAPVSGGEVVRSEVRYAPASPIRDDEFDDEELENMVDDAEKDDDGYDWTAEDDTDKQTMTPIVAPTNKPHVAHNSGNNEWYTPKEYIEAARQVMGWIDLDPATSETANTVVRADEFYTAQDDGLAQEWTGKVWMNPPYSSDLIGRFAEKLCSHYEAGDVTEAIVLINNATETGWFQRMAQTAMCVCFPRTRVKFWKPDGETGAPLQGQAILYFGTKKADFAATFRPFGFVGVINGI